MHFDSPLTRRVADLVQRRPLVACAPATSVRRAAQRMSEANVGCIVIVDDHGQACGILTDSDLRRRIVGAGRDASLAVGSVMSQPVVSVSQASLGLSAVELMLAHGIHHLVVGDTAGRASGVVSATDIVGAEARQPLLLARRIASAMNPDELTTVRAALPASVAWLLSGGVSGAVAIRIIAEINDRMTRRLLHLALAELGPAPAPFCWLALGSEGRAEQSLDTDQDNAILFEPCNADAACSEYFDRLAMWMVAALEQSGLPRCGGQATASNPLWRSSRQAWQQQWDAWLDKPTPDAIRNGLIGLDFRPVGGDPHLAIDFRRWLFARIRDANAFVAHVAGLALEVPPALDLLGRWAVPRRGPTAGMLDLKIHLLRPITDIARLLALQNGIEETGTLARLRAAEQHAHSNLADLREAFSNVQELRLRHQLACIAAGRPADNLVAPRELSRADAARLREHVHAVQHARVALAIRFPAQLTDT